MTKPDGGPAFASVTTVGDEPNPDLVAQMEPGKIYSIPRIQVIRTTGGMTLRDYFAAAVVGAPWMPQALRDTKLSGTIGEQMAQIAYATAERMLAEREK